MLSESSTACGDPTIVMLHSSIAFCSRGGSVPLPDSAFVLSNVYGAIIFALKDNHSESYSDGDMSLMTKYYFVMDWTNAFLVQWLLLYLPYQWYRCFKTGRNRFHNYLTLNQQERKARLNLKNKRNYPSTRAMKPRFIRL